MYRLLVADDERLEREAVRFLVRKNCPSIGEIDEAVNGREAVEKAEAAKPDIVFIDIKMPGLNGIEAARRIRKCLPSARIVFLTAFDTFNYAHEAIRLGAQDFLVKPVAESELIGTVEKLAALLDREKEERERLVRRDGVLQDLNVMVESELLERLAAGLVDADRLREYLLLRDSRESFPVCAGIARLDCSTYSMKLDPAARAALLVRRARSALRRAAQHKELICLAAAAGATGPAVAEVVFLLIGGRPPAEEIAKHLKEIVQREVSVDCDVRLAPWREIRAEGGGVPDIDADLQRVRAIPAGTRPAHAAFPGDGAALPRAQETRLLEALQRLDRAETLAAAEAAFRRAERHPEPADVLSELLAVLKHQVRTLHAAVDFPTVPDPALTAGPELQAAFCARVLGVLDALAALPGGEISPGVRASIELIESHYMEDMDVERIARAAGHSASHFSRLFRAEMGESVIGYLTGFRIKRARSLLAETELSTAEIGARVGYADPSYFARVFHREAGVSPTRYRYMVIRNR